MSEHPKANPEQAERSVPLPGSDRPAAARIHSVLGPADASHRIEVTVILRRREPLPECPTDFLTREELAAQHGASTRTCGLPPTPSRGSGPKLSTPTPPPAASGSPGRWNS